MSKRKSVFKKPSTEVENIPQNNMIAPEQTNGNPNIIVNRISMVAVDRTTKDIETWRSAHRVAESIYYPMRSRLYDLYMDVVLDGHLSGLMTKRIDSVLNKRLRFVDKNGEEIEEINDLINTSEFRTQNKELLLSVFWGVTGLEYIPAMEFTCKSIPRKHIKPEKKVIAHFQNDYDGTPYENLSNIWVVGEDRDLGLLLKAAFYVLLKKGNFGDWANYIEIFGQPLIVTKYDAYDQKTKEQLTAAIDNIGNTMRLAIPKQAEFDVIDGKTSNANGDLQDKFKEACNQELSVLILGNTETTKSSKSSGYAQSNTHGKEQTEIIKSDVQLLLGWLNSKKFLSILQSYGLPVEGGKFLIEEIMDVDQQKTRAEVLKILKTDLQLPIDDEDIYEEFGIAKPDNYDEIKAQQHQQHEDEETEIEEVKENGKAPQQKKPINPKKVKPKNLTAWQNFMAYMSDFFDPAHKG